jgi:hypothetical protein
MELREANGLFGVVFTSEDHLDVRLWVQDRAEQAEIVATPTRLYLPVGLSGMAQVDQDDVIWWDSEGGPNAFSIERFL